MLNLFNRAFRSPVGPNPSTMQHVQINFFATAAAYKPIAVAGPSRLSVISSHEYLDFIDEEEAEVLAYLDRHDVPSGGDLDDIIPPSSVPSRYDDVDIEEGFKSRIRSRWKQPEGRKKRWIISGSRPHKPHDEELAQTVERLEEHSRGEELAAGNSSDPMRQQRFYRMEDEDSPRPIQPRNMYAITLTCDPLNLSPLIAKALYDIGLQYQYQVLFRRRTNRLWAHLTQLRPYVTVQRMTEEKMRAMSQERRGEIRRLAYLRYLSTHSLWREVMEEDSTYAQRDKQEIEFRRVYSIGIEPDDWYFGHGVD